MVPILMSKLLSFGCLWTVEELGKPSASTRKKCLRTQENDAGRPRSRKAGAFRFYKIECRDLNASYNGHCNHK